jgi:hypothetical protein
LTRKPVALVRGVGSAPLILNGDSEVSPVEERVPYTKVEFRL